MIDRHRNGRGLVLDHAEVNAGAYISADSVVQGHARVRDARLVNGAVADEYAQVYGGVLDRAYAGRQVVIAGAPLLADETIARCRSISGTPKILHSRLEDLVEVFDSPLISEVYAHEAALIYGTAQLIGPFILGGFARVHEGVWLRPPIAVKLGHACITECIAGHILIECRCRTREYWLRHGPKFGRRRGWTEAEIAETYQVIEEWRV